MVCFDGLPVLGQPSPELFILHLRESTSALRRRPYLGWTSIRILSAGQDATNWSVTFTVLWDAEHKLGITVCKIVQKSFTFFRVQFRVFILRNVPVLFRYVGGKTTCIVQILPADRSLYPHINREQRVYVRGPTLRTEWLADQQKQFEYIKSWLPNYG